MNLSTRLPLILGLSALAALAGLLRSRPSVAPAAALTVARSDEAPLATEPREVRRPVLVVYVAGEVSHAGVFQLPAGARVEAALRAAGGANPRADLIAVNLAEPLRDGEEVVVPPRGADEGASAEADASGGGVRRRTHRRSAHRRKRGHRAASRKTLSGVVNLNADDAQRLSALPGIGAELAERIVAYRQLNGPFQNVEDVGEVAGVSDRELARITPYVTVR